MAHKAGQKEAGRAKILQSAGRMFRSHGFGGCGVDGLAKGADVTSGAFYAHFKSKADAFREAVVVGLSDLRHGVEQMRERLGDRWRSGFVDFYLGDRRTCDLADSCAVQSLSSEVARASDDARLAYEAELQGVIEAMAAGLNGKPKARREEAIALLALLVGGVTLARAVQNPATSDAIAAAVRKAAHAMETSEAH
ncbi:TetR/AcrR family transcriptional regulator [Rhodanobacter sp. DHG33]|uniref:TetR/AcrR family transcriptional regulator n=1 Tax=Rhodanobacter sp. DHG33 TaxID=2775921 RepID=UPI001782A686|nr:TetR/AcrR family transcriptional regulator [Rhodanobacter sp. DHG33]MBD8899538.1 TetR/AcrR family transcriptional regulator [Rhodanobacter sp. DHG33]